MKNLIRLTKINLLTIFDFYKIKNANTSSEKRKALSYFCLIIFAFLYLSGYILFYANVAFKGLKTMNLTSIMLPVGMSLVSTYILFMTIFTINKTIFLIFVDCNLRLIYKRGIRVCSVLRKYF